MDLEQTLTAVDMDEIRVLRLSGDAAVPVYRTSARREGDEVGGGAARGVR